jgi:hypothetical protein
MSRLHDFKKNPFSVIGGMLALTCFVLIIILFVFNLLIGGFEETTDILLYYLIPFLLIAALILLTANKFRELRTKHNSRKIRRIRRTGKRNHNNPV